jgi:periplasmic copper chaperone A
MIRRVSALILVSFAALVALAIPAGAHVEIEPEEAVAGSTTVLTFNVEFEGAAMSELAVQLPEGAAATDVPAKEGWTSEIDAAANTVTWTGGPTTDDDTFDLEVQLPTTPGVVLFPAVEQTSEGEVAWIEEEESEGETGRPAPRLTLVPDPNATSTTEASTTSTTAAEETTTTNDLPGTTLEADERDDGTTSAAPWVIGAGIAAVVAVAVGGTLLKRKQDRENEQDQANSPDPEA